MSRFPLCLALALALAAAACGGSSSNSVAPSPTATSIAVSLQAPVIAVTKTTNATGTATLTGGQSQAVTSGWRSDVPTVATVSDAGIVTGVATGRANIYVVFGGRQGQAQVRVVPNYQGQWRGTYVIRSCTQTGAVTDAGFCDTFRPNSVLPVTMVWVQNGDTVSGQFLLGTLPFEPVTAQIREDGGFAVVAGQQASADIVGAAGWSLNSGGDGRMTGVGVAIFQITGQSGEGRVAYEVLDLNRVAGGLTTRLAAPAPRTFAETFRALSTP